MDVHPKAQEPGLLPSLGSIGDCIEDSMPESSCARNQVDPWTDSVWRPVQVVRLDMVPSSGWSSEWVEGPGRRISNSECAFDMCPRVRHARHNIDTATVA